MGENESASVENNNTEVNTGAEGTESNQNPVGTEGESQTTATNSMLGGAGINNNEKNEENPEGQEESNVPENYDISAVLPEGAAIDSQEMKGFTQLAKDLKLNNEQAEKLAKYGFDYLGRGLGAYEAQQQAKQQAWAETARKELGADLNPTLVVCGRGLEAIEKQVPGIRQAIEETGVGNRIEFIKAFKVLGEALEEDTGKGTIGDNSSSNNDKTWYENSK